MSLTKSLFGTLATVLGAETALAATAGGVFGEGKTTGLNITGNNVDAATAISKIITQLLTLISIIAIAYVLWAGFQIMTAGGDEEKVKTGRKTIIYVIVGIVVMWLSYFIVKLVLDSLI